MTHNPLCGAAKIAGLFPPSGKASKAMIELFHWMLGVVFLAVWILVGVILTGESS
ncbi:MAG: hypothetical protein ACK43N_09475 [Pirellulaceae bacterium]